MLSWTATLTSFRWVIFEPGFRVNTGLRLLKVKLGYNAKD
jgi:hypothetical protein